METEQNPRIEHQDIKDLMEVIVSLFSKRGFTIVYNSTPSFGAATREIQIRNSEKIVCILFEGDENYSVAEVMIGDNYFLPTPRLFNRAPVRFHNVFDAIHTAAFYLKLLTTRPD